jgi:predicted metal-dependent HD superfamily phosphohydrolase
MAATTTDDSPAALLARWRTLAGASAEATGRDLIERWSEPHRRYHDRVHLARVLDGVDELAAEADDPDAVRYAAWFHDAVYGTGVDGPEGAGDEAVGNEELSARLAEGWLAELGLAADRIAEVARLVRLTAGHRVESGDRNGAVLADADLAILGGAPDDYAAYARAIRAEYAAVPDELFRPGRAAILTDLLGLPELFRTPTARARYEARARTNLAAEIAELTSP